MNKVEQEFIDKGLAKMRPNGKWFILTREDSIAFVEACKKESIAILGIDGFYLREEKIQPSMENGIDFTSSSYNNSKGIYSDAIDFLNQRDRNMYFEIVCLEDI